MNRLFLAVPSPSPTPGPSVGDQAVGSPTFWVVMVFLLAFYLTVRWVARRDER